VLFESPDGVLSGIAAMAVRRHQLVLHIIGGEKILQSGRCLVVESLDFWFETLDSEFLMDGIIGIAPFSGGPRFHWDEFNVVAVINIADHDILVSFSGLDREFSRQVCVKLSLVDQDGINEVGFCAQVCVIRWCFRNRCFRGGPYVLASLVHVAHGCGRRELQMFVDSVFRYAEPRDMMSVFDCL
jgi:hypothetical protein